MHLFKQLPIYLLLLLPQTALAIDALELRKADKVAITLTGNPLSPELRAKVVKGEITLSDLTEQLSKSSDFIERYAQFWVRLLGIQNQIDVLSLRLGNNGSLYDAINGREFFFTDGDRTGWPKLSVDELKKRNDANDSYTGPADLEVIDCEDGPLIRGRQRGLSTAQLNMIIATGMSIPENDKVPVSLPILPGTLAEWQRGAAFHAKITPACEENSTRINPWWDPKEVSYKGRYLGMKTYKVAPYMLVLCGPTLEKCSLTGDREVDLAADIAGTDMTMEPGYIIAHTVAENRPFAEVLTTTSTIMTGSYGEFMSHMGKGLWVNFPLKGYNDSAHPIFTKPDITDRKHYRIERNNMHAGVLTTPAYQNITNGRRAKANRAYESFLCKKFSVPEGASPDPNDSNPDLTKRAYCTYCHKSLEPMTAFWGRWPETGNTNYFYNDSKDIMETGRFDGKIGDGAPALAKILTESEAFASCSVRRAFEFVNGRKMDKTEAENLIPVLVNRFQAAQQNLRLVIKDLILAPDFLEVGGKKP